MPVFAHNGFGVKLYAVDRLVFDLQRHNLLIIHTVRSGYDGIGKIFFIDRQRVVARRSKLFRQGLEDWCVRIDMYLGGLPMHHIFCSDHLSAVSLRDALMSQTDTKYWCCVAKRFDHIQRYACIIRGGGAGREDDLFGVKLFDLLYTHLIISDHLEVGAQLFAILYDIVGETVVVVYH